MVSSPHKVVEAKYGWRLQRKSGKGRDIGGFIRDNKGRWKSGYYRSLNHCTSIRRGPMMTDQLSIEGIVVQTDSEVACTPRHTKPELQPPPERSLRGL